MKYGTLVIIYVLLSSGATAKARAMTRNDDEKQEVERTIAADPHVAVSVCVNSGRIIARTWDRNEVRARVSDGVPIELDRIDAGNKSAQTTELRLVTRDRSLMRSSCLAFGDVELDVPQEASLKLETSEGDVTVTGAGRVTARSQGGTITLAKIKTEINAGTIGGDISAKDSAGSVRLQTVSGSIDAQDLAVNGVDEVFEASTVGGDIVLKRVSSQRLKVNTIQGSVYYAGVLVRGARYSFQTISGDVTLSLPADSSFRISGTLGGGADLQSVFSLQESTSADPLGKKNVTGIRRIDAIVGTGDSAITISSFNGSVLLKKN